MTSNRINCGWPCLAQPWLSILMSWSALLVLPGCGGPEITRVALVRVRGAVTLDGKPLAKAVVVFEAADGSFSYAQTSWRGRYDLWFDSRTRGTTPGKKTVQISMNRRIHGLNSTDEGVSGDKGGGFYGKQAAELLPAKYNSESELTVEVTPETRIFNFGLKS